MKIGYVFTEVPQITGMFPNAELSEMRARGVEIELFVLRRKPAATEEARRIEREFPVHRSGYLLSARLLLDCVDIALRRPLATIQLFARVLSDTGGSPRILGKSLGILPKALHFGAVARRREVTLLHAYWASLPALGAEAMSIASGIPYTTWAHAGADIYNRNHQTSAALRSRLESARVVLTCNRANLEHFASLAGRSILSKVVLLTHGVDTERFTPAPGAASGGDRAGVRSTSGVPLSVLAVGRLSAAKGFDVLLEACRLLASRGTRVTCTIGGEGRERATLERQAREIGIADAVRFLGHVDFPSLPGLYRGADLFVMPSVIGPHGSRDGLPNVLLEAMASGLPVIGSRVASIPEAIEDGVTGLLVPPGDPKALAAAIERLAVDPGLRRRLAAAGLEKVRAEYGRGPAMDRLHRIFLELHEDAHASAGSEPIATRAAAAGRSS